jgi:hypothetical protein
MLTLETGSASALHRHPEVSLILSHRHRTNPDLHVVAQGVQQPGQALDRIPGESAPHEVGDIGLGDAEEIGGLLL